MISIVRILCALGLLAAVAFCFYGFMSTYELAEDERLPWHVGYGILGGIFLAGAIHLFRSPKGK